MKSNMETDFGPAAKHPQQLFFDNVSPATRLLEKRRQMYEVQDALENQKARFAKEEEQFRKKEEQLRAKDLQLQHQLFRFNKFLQDNEAKRRRAETRAAEEQAEVRKKEDEIRELQKQLEESKQQCQELEEEVIRNAKYEKFLERVKETTDDYNDMGDLVTRYHTLDTAYNDLVELQTHSEAKIEELRNEFQTYRRKQDMEMLALSQKIATLTTELDEVQKARQQLEQDVDVYTQEDSKHSLHFGKILMSVENIFLRCTTKRKNIQHATTLMDDEGSKGKDGEEGNQENEDSFRRKKEMAIRELRVILAYLKDFKDIVETLQRERRQAPAKHRQAGVLEAVNLPELAIEFKAEAPRGGDRASQNSSSQNTKELRSDRMPTLAAASSADASG